MAYESYPNTAHNARAITLVEHEQLVGPLGVSGLVRYGLVTTPAYADSTGRQVKIRAGVSALIRGTRFDNTTETVVAVAANASGSPRIDLLVLRLNRATYEITPVVIAGAPGAAPIAPSPVRNEAGGSPDYYDLPLCEISVPNAATTTTATQVVNRAWWISGSGYVGNSTAKPPVVAGVSWWEADTGIGYVGSSGGTFKRTYHYTGYVDLNMGSGWTGQFSLARDGSTVTGSIRIQRAGSAIGESTSPTLGPIGSQFRPDEIKWSTYSTSNPKRVCDLQIAPSGVVTFTADFQNHISTGTVLTANPTWVVAA